MSSYINPTITSYVFIFQLFWHFKKNISKFEEKAIAEKVNIFLLDKMSILSKIRLFHIDMTHMNF